MADEPRIAPVDPDAAEGAVKDIVDGQRKRWGKPLPNHLLYARSGAVFRGAESMWAAIGQMSRVDPRLRALLNRRVAAWNSCLL